MSQLPDQPTEGASSSGTEIVDGIKQILDRAYQTYENFPYDSNYRPYYIPELDYYGVKVIDEDNEIDDIWQDFAMNGNSVDRPELLPNLSLTSSAFYDNYLANRMNSVTLNDLLLPPVIKECVFCKNNGTSPAAYRKHFVKDLLGKVTCPVLRAYVCPNCFATGDNAHTLKYCPLKNLDVGEGDANLQNYRTGAASRYRHQNNRLNNNLAASTSDIADQASSSMFEDVNKNQERLPYARDFEQSYYKNK